jgi:hypothetical protein
MAKKQRTRIEEGLKVSLAQQRSGQVFGPFETPQEVMKFLDAAQKFLVPLERALRQAAKLGREYDPEKICWLLEIEDTALQKKLKRIA